MSAVVQTITDQPHSRVALAVGASTRLFAFDASGTIELGRFAREVRAVAGQLPDAGFAVNLCEDRYRFMVALCAAALRGQTTLLPPSRAPAVVDEVLAQHRDSYALGDARVGEDAIASAKHRHWQLPAALPQQEGDALTIPEDLLIAIGYTSGSTGRPKPNPKTWASFRASTMQNLAALDDLLDHSGTATSTAVTPLIATVPPQHMYGLETSVMLPLQSGSMIHSARPFFPQDIRHALESMPAPRILVTTPVHIRACVAENISLPSLEFVLSATAPLSEQLAAQAEALFATRVLEIYGCTEAGTIATRRTVEGETWRTLDGIVLRGDGEACAVDGSHLDAPVPLNDIVRTVNARQFSLLGRKSDLINIAGKRMSLGDLNHKLNEIEGVVEGVYVMPDEENGPVTRLMAFVVAPGLSHEAIMAGLRQRIDPVFLPRPLYLVESLPRNETGKLARASLLQIAARCDVAPNGAQAG